jgi:ribonucleoside-triphosphate reductase (thioredoxin)
MHSKQNFRMETTVLDLNSAIKEQITPKQYEEVVSSNKFKLSDNFLDKYKRIHPPFGFNGLGELVYMRTYSRLKPNGTNEVWWETVARVVEGTFNMQKTWIEQYNLGWNNRKAQKSAQEMYDRIFQMKFLPPGRGLWAMGSPITEERGLFAALNNCAFISTDNIKEELSKSFCFLMDASMLGVGVGFDTKGAGKIEIKKPKESIVIDKILDSREGWVNSIKLLIESYFYNSSTIDFDYSLIRQAGTPIKGFGGISSGSKPLEQCHKSIRKVLDKNIGQTITVRTIVDIMNLIGTCVIAGNLRRTAEISFGDYKDKNYLDLKNYKVNPDRESYGWTSNNSIFADLGMDYTEAANRTSINGEPGYAWLENMKGYSRMNNGPDNKDHRVSGGNPCLEQSLEHAELCCLVETFPNRHDTLDDYLQTLKYAYLYAKTVTLGKTHWPETNRVMLRNRRIGCSISGIAQFITKHGLHKLKEWCEEGYKAIDYYDTVYSDWLAIPKSIKKTSIKPSGSVSLLAGATPGLHFPESRFYIRRMRLAKSSELVEPFKKAGYNIEICKGDEDSTVVVEIPVDVGEGIRTINNISLWEQLSLAAFMQKHWADNQVSCTVTFQEEEAKQIKYALEYFQYQLKGISFLPKIKLGTAYAQMPYEEITEEKYKKLISNIKPLKLGKIHNEEAEVEKFCSTDVCQIK